MTDYLIIGLGTAGMFAAKAIGLTDRESGITIVEKRPYAMYSPCSLPYALAGEADLDALVFGYPAGRRTRLLLSSEATRIDHASRLAFIRTPNGESQVGYDRLVLALGARPVVPPISGLESVREGVLTLQTVEDARRIMEWTGAHQGPVVVAGAGAIGLEVAHALSGRHEVHVVEMKDQILPSALDPEIAKIAAAALTGHGVRLRLGTAVRGVETEDGRVSAVLAGDERIPCETLVLSVGVRPATVPIEGLAVDNGGIVVDDGMATNLEGVWAAGDCTGARTAWGTTAPKLATTAARQGTVAGTNAAGGSAVYTPSLGAFATTLGSLEAAAVGPVSSSPGVEAVSVKVDAQTRYSWAGGEKVTVKLFAERATGRVLGVQAVGPGAHHIVDVVAVAVRLGAHVEDLVGAEHAYCPKVSELHSPLNAAADLLRRRVPARAPIRL